MNKFFLLISLILYSCNNSDNCLQEYRVGNQNGKPIFYIDFSKSTESQCKYVTESFAFYFDQTILVEMNIEKRGNLFIGNIINPESEEFILFNLDSKLNKNYPIKIKFSNFIKTFDCIRENKIITRENLEVNIFRIKNWTHLAPFEDRLIDAVVFVTKENGVIGSYLSDIKNNEQIMLVPTGQILNYYIDYSKVRLHKLL